MADDIPENEDFPESKNIDRLSRHATFSRSQRLRKPLNWRPKEKNPVEAIPSRKNAPKLKDGRKAEKPDDG